ncbi:unnamed protein product [Cylicostephanus goldi]|uniref:RGS domain-containing protein n=1 Tax=Cylicostephanus goldi TaxID=71465 RepID=A0A3P6RLW0_CYLGO|nr:unnamed protein product [Cylicostephanus goldi]
MICSYSYIVEKQPIGKLLFHDFCEATNNQYYQSCVFLNKVEEYETSDDDVQCRRKLARAIAGLLAPGGDTPSSSQHDHSPWCSFLPENVVNSVLAAADSATHDQEPRSDLFAEAYKLVRAYLADQPFKQFLDSIQFYRYLQWKWLEKRPVDKHTFRLYRVLGKGGFGEVCACQVSAM